MENKKVDAVTLVQAFKYPSWMKLLRENCSPDGLVDVRMTHVDLKTIVDLADEKREMQQKRGIRLIRVQNGFDVRCNKCGTPLFFCGGFKNFEDIEKQIKAPFKFCMCCGNDLREKVHRT